MQTLQDRVKTIAAEIYTADRDELFAAPGVNRALPFLLLTDTIEKNAKALDKRFPEPLLEYVL